MLARVRCNLCNHAADDLLVDLDSSAAIMVDRAPLCRGHLLVVPRVHAASVDDLPAESQRMVLERVEEARAIAMAIGGKEAIALEHGRSPTCGDRSCSCHAHIHVVPAGEVDEETLQECGLTAHTRNSGGPYLSLSTGANQRRQFSGRAAVPHWARSVAAAIAAANGVRWRPLMAGPDSVTAKATMKEARARVIAEREPSKDETALSGARARKKRKPVVVVCGPTGSGKSSVGLHMARELGTPAVELGVILRLVSLGERAEPERRTASRLWRWAKRGRLDFDGVSIHQLTAAVPRLDGGGSELPMWTQVERARLSTLARSGEVQEVLAEIAARVSRTSGAVIVGRVAPEMGLGSESRVIALDAAPSERASRKNRQLASVGLRSSEHDWFSPRLTSDMAPIGGERIDTTRLTAEAMCQAALAKALDEGEEMQVRAS